MLNWFRKHGFGQQHQSQPVNKSGLSSSAPDLTEDEVEKNPILLEKVVLSSLHLAAGGGA